MSDVVVMTFDDANEASEAREALKQLERRNLLDLEDAAIVVRDAEGKVHVKNEIADSTKIGAVGGGILGLLFVFMFPVAGVAIGAAGGALVGNLIDHGIDKTFVDEVSDALKPGASALFLSINSANENATLAALKPFTGTVYQTSLSSEMEASLSDVLR